MEECNAPVVNTGLRGVTIASTKISDVIGDLGKLIYRGVSGQRSGRQGHF